MPSTVETWTVNYVQFVDAHIAVVHFDDATALEVVCKEETCHDWLAAARKEATPVRLRVASDVLIDDGRPDPGFPSRYYAERELEEERGW